MNNLKILSAKGICGINNQGIKNLNRNNITIISDKNKKLKDDRFEWTKYLGHALIKNVVIKIGDW
jgi:hypothetical protein